MALLQIFVYLVKAQKPLDFIKPNAIWKLAYKDKYIDQIKKLREFWSRFFGNSIIRFLKLVGLIVNNMEWINTRKRNTTTKISVQSVKIIFILFRCHRSTDNWIDLYLFILPWKSSKYQRFGRENSKPRRKLRVTTR